MPFGLRHYLIDTNIWSHLQRRTTQALLARFAALKPGQTFLSPVVLGEMETSYLKGDRAPYRRVALDQIIGSCQILAVNRQVAIEYAQLRAKLEQAGTPIGPNDTWIAAEALHHKLVLVTDNVREFSRVPGLAVENWL
ncbi:MAG: PIN domain-containing protein [Rhodoferax sp.]|nr:PIN domain-containing protein [Rhodoferax sp.]